LKNKKYAIVPKKEFIIPEYLNIYKNGLRKTGGNWKELSVSEDPVFLFLA
jgi:hypothetical protein